MPAIDRKTRILELRRLVQNAEYQIDPLQVAASIIRKSGQLDPVDFPLSSKASERSVAAETSKSKSANHP
jgi:hypothetical protein